MPLVCKQSETRPPPRFEARSFPRDFELTYPATAQRFMSCNIIQYVPALQISAPVEMILQNQEGYPQQHNMNGAQMHHHQQQHKDSNPHEASLRESIRNQQVENALAVLAQEAGFSEETIATLRQAVDTGRRMKEGMAMGVQVPPPMAPTFLNGLTGAPVRVAPRTVKPASSKRQQLTVEEAAEIYSLRPTNSLDVLRGSMAHCRTIAPRYGVTPKTIRDVWSGRTWAEATRHLWTAEEVVQRAKRDAARRTSLKKEGSEDDEDEDESAVQQQQAPPAPMASMAPMAPMAPMNMPAPMPIQDNSKPSHTVSEAKPGEGPMLASKEMMGPVPAPVGHPVPEPVA